MRTKILGLFSRKNDLQARASKTVRLDAGVAFPRMNWRTVDGESLVVPDDFTGRWVVLLIYRGHW
jgi:hypothetical protein